MEKGIKDTRALPYKVRDAPPFGGSLQLTPSSAPKFHTTAPPVFHLHHRSVPPTNPPTDALAEMPSTTSDRKVQSRIKATSVARGVRASSESSDTSPEREEGNETTCSGPEDLDQPWPYEFKVTV